MRQRIVTIYLVLTVIVSSVVAYITYRYSSQMYIREIETGLQHEAILINSIIQGNSVEKINDAYVKNLSLELTSRDQKQEPGHRRITVIGRNGTVLADSTADSSGMENHSDRPEFANAIKSSFGVDIRRSETTGWNMIYLAYASPDLNHVVRVSASLENINDIRNTILFYAVIAVIVGMLLSSVIVLKLSEYVVRPVVRLVKEYGGEAGTNQSYIKREDEVGQLSSTLSSMTRHIENIITELKDRNVRVDTIINSMDNGLIAVDRSMHVLMINPIAVEIFGATDKGDFIGVPLVQVIRNRQINELLIKAIASNKVLNDEILLYQGGKRVYSVHVSPIYPMDDQHQNSGALAHIYDITQMRKLEELRSEFVSNVTHELKTPLTSIQGFVETLKSGAIEDPSVSGRFLDIIDIEAARLHTLINDILELSEIENKKQEGEKEVFELLPLVQEIESMLENSASDKNVTFTTRIDADLKLEAERYRIKQLMINLMDNAIKYNKPGGNVTVTAESLENQIVIHVKDTGIGIPSDHTARIFERFYRVDKGRSREMGGTGLGLSIVKHIAQLYGGSVRVESEEGKGSDFIITLPK